MAAEKVDIIIQARDKASQKFALIGKSADVLNRSIRRAGMLAAAGGAAVAGGLVLMAKKSMESVDAIAKLSDRLGVSTEFLSAFGHEADLSGISTEAFCKGMEMFVRRLGEVKQGTGQAKQGLKALGLTADELIQMGPEKAFLRIAEGIRGMQNQSEKAATAYAFFGRSGSQMLNLLESNLDGTIERAKELGITFSREQAAGIEEANDAITRMQASFEGVGNALAISVAPLITKIADTVAKTVSGVSGIERMQTIVKNIAIGTTYIADGFLIIRGVVNSIVAFVQKLISQTIKVTSMVAGVAERINRFLGFEMLENFSASVKETINEFSAAFSDAAAENMRQAIQNFKDIGAARKTIRELFEEKPITITAKKTIELLPEKEEEEKVVEKRAMKRAAEPSGGFGSFEAGRFALYQMGRDPMTQIAQSQLQQTRRQTDSLLKIYSSVQQMVINLNRVAAGLAPIKATRF